MKLNLKTIKENEASIIVGILNLLQPETTICDMVKFYLRNLSLNYDQLWYSGIDEIYASLFEMYSKYSDVFEELEKYDFVIKNYVFN